VVRFGNLSSEPQTFLSTPSTKETVMKKLAVAAIAGGVFFIGSLNALADIGSPFPKTQGPLDLNVPVGTADTSNPLPKQFRPVDRSVDIAMSDAADSFPKSYGPIDRSIDIAMPEAKSPFPKDHVLGRVIA
jgi:hypothetical protein